MGPVDYKDGHRLFDEAPRTEPPYITFGLRARLLSELDKGGTSKRF